MVLWPTVYPHIKAMVVLIMFQKMCGVMAYCITHIKAMVVLIMFQKMCGVMAYCITHIRPWWC